MSKARKTNIVGSGIGSIGRSAYEDESKPLTISSTAGEKSIAPAVGRHMTIRMSEREAQWAGRALLRYGWTPEEALRDMNRDKAFGDAFEAELARGIERAVEAGEKAIEELVARQEAIAERRRQAAAEPVSVIEDSTDRGFDPTAYGNAELDRVFGGEDGESPIRFGDRADDPVKMCMTCGVAKRIHRDRFIGGSHDFVDRLDTSRARE